MEQGSISTVLNAGLWALAPAIVPGAVGLGLLLAERLFPGKLSPSWSRLLAFLALLTSGWLELRGGFGHGGGSPFLHDPFARFVILCAIVGLSLLVALFGHRRGGGERHTQIYSQRLTRFFAAVLLTAMGVIFAATANDLITLFIGLELCAFPVYMLILRRLADSDSIGSASSAAQRRATKQVFVFGLVSSIILAFGLATLYGLGGATGFIQLRVNLSIVFLIHKKIGPALIVASALIGAGLAARMGLVPFHLWLGRLRKSDESGALPLALLGGPLAGLVGISRVFNNSLIAFSDPVMAPLDWTPLFIALFTLTAFLASVASFRENSVMRIAIWLALAQSSFLLLGPISSSGTGMSAALFQALGLVIVVPLLFSLLEGFPLGGGDQTIQSMRGLARRAPLSGGMLALAIASLGAAPFTAGMSARIYLAQETIKTGGWWVIAVLATATIVLLVVATRTVITLYRAPLDSPGGQSLPALSAPARILGAVAIAGIIYLGLAPDALWEIATEAGSGFSL